MTRETMVVTQAGGRGLGGGRQVGKSGVGELGVPA